jgi:hypothetical protein
MKPMQQNFIQKSDSGYPRQSSNQKATTSRRSIPNSPPLQVLNVDPTAPDIKELQDTAKIIYPDLLNINHINLKRKESNAGADNTVFMVSDD